MIIKKIYMHNSYKRTLKSYGPVKWLYYIKECPVFKQQQKSGLNVGLM